MSIIHNSSLGFTDPISCPCDTDFCLPVSKEDGQQWQVAATCPEVTGGTEKLPCESDQMGAFPEVFTIFNASHVTVNSGYFSVLSASSSDYVLSADDYLDADKYYVVKYTITGYLSGTIGLVGGIQRSADGVYTEVVKIGANGKFGFVYFNPDEGVATMTVSSIFISCIRYSQLYDLDIVEADEGVYTYESQTKFCVSGNPNDGTKYRLIDTAGLIPGMKYTICFTLEGAYGPSGGIGLVFGDYSHVFTANGKTCIEQEYVDTFAAGFYFEFGSDLNLCISDITINQVVKVKAGLFDTDGNEIPDGLVTEEIGSTVKITLSDDVEPGCYTIGVADSCSNYKYQFYGNLLDGPKTDAVNIDPETGAFTVVDNGTGVFDVSITLKDAVCCGKLYSTILYITSLGGEDQLNIESIQVDISNLAISAEIENTLPFTGEYPNGEALCLEDTTDVVITVRVHYNNNSGSEPVPISLNFQSGSSITMDEGQMCPEKHSICLKIQDVIVCTSTCPSVFIEYRDAGNVLGFDYTSEGYRESDGFMNSIRIPGEMKMLNYPVTKNIQKKSNGRRDLYYADIDKKVKLNTNLLPVEIHDALVVALQHGKLYIDGNEYVNASEEYAPEITKNSCLSAVSQELYVQKDRTVKTVC